MEYHRVLPFCGSFLDRRWQSGTTANFFWFYPSTAQLVPSYSNSGTNSPIVLTPFVQISAGVFAAVHIPYIYMLYTYSIIFREGRRLNLALEFPFSLSPCWGDTLGIRPHVLCKEAQQNQVWNIGINSSRGQARQDLALWVLWQPWCSFCGHESYDTTVLLLIFIF